MRLKSLLKIWRRRSVSRSLLLIATLAWSPSIYAQQASVETPIDQGSAWNEQTRQAFYNVDHGSRIAPLKWVESFTADDGSGFLSDCL